MFFQVFTSHGQIASLECYSIFRLSCAIISSTHENLKCLGKSWFAFSFKTQFFCRLRDLQNLFLLDPRLLNAILHINYKKRRRIYLWMLNVSFNHTVVILHEWKDSDICRVLSFDCSPRAQVIHAKTTVHVSRITKRIHTVVVAPLAIGVVIVAKVSINKNNNSNNYKFFLKFS